MCSTLRHETVPGPGSSRRMAFGIKDEFPGFALSPVRMWRHNSSGLVTYKHSLMPLPVGKAARWRKVMQLLDMFQQDVPTKSRMSSRFLPQESLSESAKHRSSVGQEQQAKRKAKSPKKRRRRSPKRQSMAAFRRNGTKMCEHGDILSMCDILLLFYGQRRCSFEGSR